MYFHKLLVLITQTHRGKWYFHLNSQAQEIYAGWFWVVQLPLSQLTLSKHSHFKFLGRCASLTIHACYPPLLDLPRSTVTSRYEVLYLRCDYTTCSTRSPWLPVSEPGPPSPLHLLQFLHSQALTKDFFFFNRSLGLVFRLCLCLRVRHGGIDGKWVVYWVIPLPWCFLHSALALPANMARGSRKYTSV